VAQLHLTIISPERTLLDDMIDEVILPTFTGQIAILPHHMPLVAQIVNGDIVVKHGGKETVAVVYGGFIYVKGDNEVLILADAVEHLHELNETEIMAAKERVEAAKKNAGGDGILIAASEAELGRITAQLRSITKHSGIKRRRGADIKDIQ
jgi:F-type H+-transporting ATPase subunit epsilon